MFGNGAASMFAESIFDERDRELWPESAGPSWCDSFDKLPRDRDNCAADVLEDDNNCHEHRQVAAFWAVVLERRSTMPYADAAVVDWATAVAVGLSFAVHSSALCLMHPILAELLIALDLVTDRIACWVSLERADPAFVAESHLLSQIEA